MRRELTASRQNVEKAAFDKAKVWICLAALLEGQLPGRAHKPAP